MTCPRGGFKPIVFGLGIVSSLSCGDSAMVSPQPPTPPPAPPAPATLSITPPQSTLPALGDTVRLAGEVRNQNGGVMSGAAISWASGDTLVATVDQSGLVTARGNGGATITARSGSVSATAAVAVEQVATGVVVDPDSLTFRNPRRHRKRQGRRDRRQQPPGRASRGDLGKRGHIGGHGRSIRPCDRGVRGHDPGRGHGGTGDGRAGGEKVIEYRERVEGDRARALVAAGRRTSETLVLWGGVLNGELRLEPAFRITSPARLPEETGPYRLEGAGNGGETAFSLDFAPGVDKFGDKYFFFTIPIEADWAGVLDRVTLTGPEGEVTLDAAAERPISVLTDRATGRIRAILRDRNAPPSALGRAGDLDVATFRTPADALRPRR